MNHHFIGNPRSLLYFLYWVTFATQFFRHPSSLTLILAPLSKSTQELMQCSLNLNHYHITLCLLPLVDTRKSDYSLLLIEVIVIYIKIGGTKRLE
jgi:hypothetical protein